MRARCSCPYCGGALVSADRIVSFGTLVDAPLSARLASCACGVEAMIARDRSSGRPYVVSWSAPHALPVKLSR
jgi:hypothetical protein